MYSRVGLPPVSEAKCGFTTPPSPPIFVHPAPPRPDPKFHKKISLKQIHIWGPCWRPGRTKRSIVANWAPKTTPKWSPKWSPSNNGRSSRNMRRHERIACPPPPGELRFRSFSYTGKRSPKSHNHSDLRTWLQNDPQSAPPGSQNGA